MTDLDPQARSPLEAMQAAGLPPLFTLPVADARRARRRQLVAGPPRVEMVKVEDDLVPGRWTASGCAGTGHARTPSCRANATI